MHTIDIFLTALAPALWGTTYVVTTELLPPGHPLTDSLIRALPAGLLLLACVRVLPSGIWLWRVFVLGALNFSLFWTLIFVAAYRLPGGVAAILIAMQPLVVFPLSRILLGTPVRFLVIIAALGGILGVVLLILKPSASLDAVGIAAGLAGAASGASGIVLTKRWQPPVSTLTYTAWQLTAGGLQLVPFALLLERPLPTLTLWSASGFLWLCVMNAAVSCVLWIRGITRLGAAMVSPLVLLSPVTAVLLGWIVLDQTLTAVQFLGIALVFLSIWLSQSAQAPPAPVGKTAATAEAFTSQAVARPKLTS